MLSRIGYYKHEVEKAIKQGYHEDEMATHDDGVHHKQFLENKEQLEIAVDEYLNIRSGTGTKK